MGTRRRLTRSEVRSVAASLEPGAIGLCHEHACASLETVAAWAGELSSGDFGTSARGRAAFAKALAREVRGQLTARLVAQLHASARPAVRRAVTVAILQLAESLGPLDLTDWLWTAEQVLPPLVMLARKETDAAATAELILLSAALGGTAGAAFVGHAACRAADCALGRGPWRQLMTGMLGQRQAVWVLHRVLELGCLGALGSVALAAVLRKARVIAQAVDFCVINGSEPQTRDVAACSLRLLQQLVLDATANTEEHHHHHQQQQSSHRQHYGANTVAGNERQTRELSKITAVLRQAVSSQSGRTLYGQPILSWECAFGVIMQTEHGLVRPTSPTIFSLASTRHPVFLIILWPEVRISPIAALGCCTQDCGQEPEVDCTELTRALDRLGLGMLQKDSS